MSDYCDADDLAKLATTARLAQLADLDRDGSADADVLADAIARASREIDGYISPRYAVPFPGTIPDLLRAISARWSLYLLMLDRDSVTNDAREQHKEDVRFLERVGDGKASLGDPVNAGDGDPSPGTTIVAETKEFTRTKLTGW